MKQKMLENIDAIIFDLDGTMVDSMWMWHSIDIEYLGRYQITLPDNLQQQIEGMSFSETAAYFKETFGLEDSLEQIKADWNQMAWEKYTNQVPLKEGIMEFLKGCKTRGIKLGIATSNSRELVNNVLHVHQLESFFQSIKTGCEVLKGKPAPDIYLAVAKELDVPCNRCLVFEDIVPGIQAGLNAGMKVCAVEDNYSLDQKEKKQELADFYIKDFHGFFLVGDSIR